MQYFFYFLLCALRELRGKISICKQPMLFNIGYKERYTNLVEEF